LLNKATHTASEAAAYEFTTLTVIIEANFYVNTLMTGPWQAIPGVIEYKGARIQLLDLPGIIEGASQGRGRGRQVVSSKCGYIIWGFLTLCIWQSAAKTADLILIMLDVTKSEEQRRLLEFELDAVGIRLNKNKPDVVFKKRTTGGVYSDFFIKVIKALADVFFLDYFQHHSQINENRWKNHSYNSRRMLVH
jgi:uncharacterized protein